MRDNHAPSPIRLADYEPPAFLVDTAELEFFLEEDSTRVKARLQMRRNPQRPDGPRHCELDGQGLKLHGLWLNDLALANEAFEHGDEGLVLFDVPERFVLASEVEIYPASNTALEGLYLSNGMYCTQCEAEGFRRITFFPDRPDVLCRFTTTIHAQRERFPVLLSNGNPVATGEEADRHWIRWDDPYPKPGYLFALVAGDLACKEDEYTTGSGRRVALRIYAAQRDLAKLDHAMSSLKAAMAWDEHNYGREYDLDIYMVVAVSHFNMGAMENKGLNVFNTACVLAHPDTTTDQGYQRVEAVVAHEYFHNWSGNRVTCRDWFQLSLKEGFTVFRDSQFSADMNSPGVKRIEDVALLRSVQFPEDQGPMAHPVRPDEYHKIDNFYTITVYEKGAELVRMQYHLLGAEAFRRGADLYFERFDGQAVTCDDFVDCMAEAGEMDLETFRRWYRQAGTPRLTVEDDHRDGIYHLRLRQHTPDTPGQSNKKPVMIPVRLALLDGDGQRIPLRETGETETVLTLDGEEQAFSFSSPEKPVPSLLRGFSAPVELRYPFTTEQLTFLLARDDDGYCRWDAAQRLYLDALQRLRGDVGAAREQAAHLAPVLTEVAQRAEEDPAQTALLLSLPGEVTIGDRHDNPIDPEAIHQARTGLLRELGEAMADTWWSLVERMATPGPYKPEASDIGRRSLRYRALEYLAAAQPRETGLYLARTFENADNITDRLNALRLLLNYGLDGATEALDGFYLGWDDEPLALDQWFAVQAGVPAAETVDHVADLMEHPDFDWHLPNRIRALLGTLANGNPVAFHRSDAEGYVVFARALKKLDGLNPQIAANMAGAASRLVRLEATRQGRFREQLERLRMEGCSDNLAEVLGRILD